MARPEGQAYLQDMQWAVEYALLNRKVMLRAALKALELRFDEAQMINIPHNYAAVEEHFGAPVVVHRKGATSARVDELGIIPGSMGTPSYIVRGLGNPDSYNSCSHGAGRAMGRKQARRVLTGGDFAEALTGHVQHGQRRLPGRGAAGLQEHRPGAQRPGRPGHRRAPAEAGDHAEVRRGQRGLILVATGILPVDICGRPGAALRFWELIYVNQY